MLTDAAVEATVPTSDLGRARSFYEDTLGLTPAEPHSPGVDLVFACGGGTRLLVYEAVHRTAPAHTVAHFAVDDVRATVNGLRERGVVFEEYDLPRLKTEDGVATVGNLSFAWFRDPDGNVVGIHGSSASA